MTPATGLAGLEAALARLLRAGGPAPGVARFSRLGEHAAIWLVIGTTMSLCAPWERRRAWRKATRRVLGAYAVNQAVKVVAHRPRPADGLSSTMTQLSFPSAHATTSFAGARGFTRAGAPAATVYPLAAALALSRLRLGVHHPSDVVIGAALGFVLAGDGR